MHESPFERLYWRTVKVSSLRAKVRNVPVTPTPSIFPKVLPYKCGGGTAVTVPYKWEAYCSTNGRRTAGFPFLRSLEARKAQRYKWGVYCRARCTAVLFRQVVGVGVSETLPTKAQKRNYSPHRQDDRPDFYYISN